jgi:hypothetical protein
MPLRLLQQRTSVTFPSSLLHEKINSLGNHNEETQCSGIAVATSGVAAGRSQERRRSHCRCIGAAIPRR